jgi:predicted acylesterase/phospholipase RssA
MIKSCQVLALEGGGSKGAYGAGALLELANHLDRSWDAVSGVSAGAINAVLFSVDRDDA